MSKFLCVAILLAFLFTNKFAILSKESSTPKSIHLGLFINKENLNRLHSDSVKVCVHLNIILLKMKKEPSLPVDMKKDLMRLIEMVKNYLYSIIKQGIYSRRALFHRLLDLQSIEVEKIMFISIVSDEDFLEILKKKVVGIVPESQVLLNVVKVDFCADGINDWIVHKLIKYFNEIPRSYDNLSMVIFSEENDKIYLK